MDKLIKNINTIIDAIENNYHETQAGRIRAAVHILNEWVKAEKPKEASVRDIALRFPEISAIDLAFGIQDFIKENGYTEQFLVTESDGTILGRFDSVQDIPIGFHPEADLGLMVIFETKKGDD